MTPKQFATRCIIGDSIGIATLGTCGATKGVLLDGREEEEMYWVVLAGDKDFNRQKYLVVTRKSHPPRLTEYSNFVIMGSIDDGRSYKTRATFDNIEEAITYLMMI